jgi:hypothetical protein
MGTLNGETAKAILSGAYERRRGYLTNQLTTWNQVAATGTIAVWAFFVRWETLLGQHSDPRLFATQIAWASALSSLLIGFWRYWSHVVDNDIVRVYPAIYLSERLVLPPQLCTISPPNGEAPLSSEAISSGIEYRQIQNKDFGGRGHTCLDVVGGVLIVLFAVSDVLVAMSLGTIAVPCVILREPAAFLLLWNLVGLTLIAWGYLSWKGKTHDWPVVKKAVEATGTSGGPMPARSSP